MNLLWFPTQFVVSYARWAGIVLWKCDYSICRPDDKVIFCFYEFLQKVVQSDERIQFKVNFFKIPKLCKAFGVKKPTIFKTWRRDWE